jgi:hypothetical protein
MQVPVQIDVCGKAVLGILHVPKNALPGLPVLVMCYGFNGNRSEEHRMTVTAGRVCEEAGIHLLRLDYRGQGVSEGEFWEVSINTRVQDIISAVLFLNGCFGKDRPAYYFIGFSDGARIASSVALLYRETKGIILWNPIFSMDSGEHSSGENGPAPRIVREPSTGTFVYPMYGLWLNTNYLRELKQNSSYDNFVRFEGKKLCIFGSDDRYTIPVREKIQKDKANLNTRIEIVDGAQHLFGSTQMSEQVIKTTLDWIKDDQLQ